MKQVFIFLFMVTFYLGSVAYAEEPNLDAIRIQYHLPALGAALIQDNSINTYVSGVRKWGDETPATVNDQFHLGSDTKAMTATLVAIFVERGLLTWDTTLAEIFPDVQMYSSYKDVTIKMLTAHRSGVTGDLSTFKKGMVWEKMWDPALDPVEGRKMVVQEILTVRPAYMPGAVFEYSNANYIIVGAILEKISGKSWESLMQDDIFTPLHMNSCGFGAAGNPDLQTPDEPWPHEVGSDDYPTPVTPGFYADNPPTQDPAGAVHCSMQDWAIFLKVHMDGFNGIDTPILKAASFKMLHESYPGQEYTPGGWYRVERDWADGPTLTHVGTNLLNYAVVWLAPRKHIGILSVTNVGGDNADAGTDAAIEAVNLSLPGQNKSIPTLNLAVPEHDYALPYHHQKK